MPRLSKHLRITRRITHRNDQTWHATSLHMSDNNRRKGSDMARHVPTFVRHFTRRV
ncbi:MAG: hypothetical protein HDS84_02725 [Bacteroidales bacterium]|nr:hypothetical protein [Bacteroidales bacterium]